MTAKDTGLKALVKLTRAQFGSILHDPDTKYIVTDGETVREYLGDIPIGGGGASVIGTISGTVTPTLTGRIMYHGGIVSGSIEEG